MKGRLGSVLRALREPRVQLALKLIVSLTLVSWLVYATDREALGDALLEVDVWSALPAVLVLLALIVVQAWRWTFVTRALDIPLSLPSSYLICHIGVFFNQVLPSSIGGDAMRIWRLRQAHVRTGPAIASVFLDRVVAAVGIVLIVTAGLPLLLRWMDTTALELGAIAVVLIAVAGVAFLVVADRLPIVRRLAEGVLVQGVRVPQLTRRVLFHAETGIPAVGLSIVIQVGIAFTVWLLARAAGAELALVEATFLVPVVIMFSTIPITVAGWGVREGAMVVALGTVGVEREEALAVSVLFGIAMAVAALPGGLIWLATGSRSPTTETQTELQEV